MRALLPLTPDHEPMAAGPGSPGSPDIGLHILVASPEDRLLCERVEDWLAAHAAATPFHRPAWLRAVARGARQESLLVVGLDSMDRPLGLVPLTVMHSPLFGRALVSSGFAVGGGIVADSPRVADRLAAATWDLAQRLSCPSVELRGGPAPSGAGWASDSSQYLGFARALEPDDESQLLAVPRKHRAEIRKGLANDLSVEIGRDERLLDIHYRLYAQSVHRLGTPVFPRALFAALLEEMGAAADILLLSRGGRPLTSILTLWHGDRCMPYYQGAAAEARAARSNDAAYFLLMREARARGCRLFDFGRSKLGTGPAAWKRSWGWPGEPLTYHYRTGEGAARRDINPLSPANRLKVEAWKRLPLSVANRLGPLIARGLG